jgi:hypothetical protein
VQAVSARDEETAARDLLRQAMELGIPCQRILAEEIRAERLLQLSLSDVTENWPLWPAFWILPMSLLNSWRVRDRIHALAWEASRRGCTEAARQLRALHAHLSGRQNGRPSDATVMARHLWFGYQRVLSLTRIARQAEKLRGEPADRMKALRQRATCSHLDATWAVDRLSSPTRGHSVDDAMRRARDEGFELPEDENEFRAFRRLRSFVRSSPHLSRLRSASALDSGS